MYEKIREKRGFISDMDGVLYHGNNLLSGVPEFVNWLIENEKEFIFLTNSSERTPQELSRKLKRMGLDVSAEHFYTSALATAEFLAAQNPGCSAYVIGEAGLVNALYDEGIDMNDVNPEYVIVGDTRTYNFEKIEKAIALVNNPLMVRHANKALSCHTEETVFIGDRMDTDIISGLESLIDTVLVLSGVTTEDMIKDFPYRPTYVMNGVGDILK